MDQLTEFFLQTQTNKTISVTSYIVIVLLSVTSSYVLAYVYGDATKQRTIGGMGINNIFPLFSASVTTLFCLLQFSLPLSLGLLGSLSIVRFRTPIKDPVDTAFVLVIIANSLLASLTLFLPMIFFVLVIAGIMQLIKYSAQSNSFFQRAPKSQIVITIPSDIYHESEEEILKSLRTVLPMIDIKSIAHSGERYHLNLSGKVDPEANISLIRNVLPENSTVNMFFDEFIAQ